MFRALGFLIMLWGVSLYFGNAMRALDDAAVATLQTVEFAAQVSETQLAELGR